MRANASLSCLILLLSAAAGFAQVPAVTSFTGGVPFATISSPPSDQTVGFTFTANSDLIVSALGVWDSATGDPLTQSHQVGLWTSGGALLASATVLTSSPLTGSWRYVAITPVTLTAGQTYAVGSAVTSPYTDLYTRVDAPAANVTTTPLITIGVAANNATAAGFSFPGTTNASFDGRFGPNLLVQAVPAAPTATAPISPFALGVTAVSLALLATLVMRRTAAHSRSARS